MMSLQLVSLTEHGRRFLASKRRTVAVLTGVLVAGGTAVYVQSHNRHKCNVSEFNDQQKLVGDVNKTSKMKGTSRKRRKSERGVRSLQVIAAILISQMGRTGVQNLMALVITVVLRSYLSNRLAKVQGFLFRAAFLQRASSFLHLMIENLILCLLQSTLFSTTKYLTAALSLHFRKTLTNVIHEYYFENMVYYKLSHVDGRITNAEQRIASDTPRFCLELSELLQEDLIAMFDALLYSWQLCSYASPKYVIWILAYVLGAGSTIRNFSPSFAKLMSQEQQLAGDYHQCHSRLRTHSESIAFYGGENREEYHITQRFQALVKHLKLVHFEHWWFGMIQDFLLKYLGATVGVILIMEPFFSGNLRSDSSTLGRAEMLSNLRYHASVIASIFQSLGTLSSSSRRLNRLSGYADRIHSLMVFSRELSTAHDKSRVHEKSQSNHFTEAEHIEFSGVKVVTPRGNVLVDDLTLRLETGCNLLITGPNGSGKSSLFRVLGGLWPLVSGHIVKPGVGSDLNKEIFYVPQRPYTALGTLGDQLIYPLSSDGDTKLLSPAEMVELLRTVDLEYLLEHYPLDKEVNWGDELSLGEQQRLGMARLFYHKPKFAILDECTSAVTMDMEERFCAKVRAMGTSCITISHRPTLVAFHDMVLSLDGEGGWSIQDKRVKASVETMSLLKSSETCRQSDAMAVRRAFVSSRKGNLLLKSKSDSYMTEVIASSPAKNDGSTLPVIPYLQIKQRPLISRVAAMLKILVPTLLDKQGAQLFALSLLVVSRTWISDRIASLNGTSVKYVLEQNKAAFVRLIGTSVIQSSAYSIISPSLRFLTAKRALGWHVNLTQHLLNNYLKKNAFYKIFHLVKGNVDADQRIARDVEKLTTDMSGLVTGMVKPVVDILWFTWRMNLLTGQRGVALLYAYMLFGLGFLRSVTPDFSDLTSKEQELEGTFRFMHSRVREHAESIAFFGGGFREKAIVDSRFKELLFHSKKLQKKKWVFGVLNDFITKQFPHIVTWGLSFLYSMENEGDRTLVANQGHLAHDLRYLASVVSQSFLSFGDILELHRKFHVLSGGINRIFELDELLDDSQTDVSLPDVSESLQENERFTEDKISFSKVNIISPGQKLLVKQLTFDIVQGKSLLVTGPNGSGKSSIFRVLRGLWPIASGRFVQPSQHINETVGSECKIFYIPQRPYISLGTLRDQIIYPFSHEKATNMVKASKASGISDSDACNLLDEHLKSILEKIRLVYLLDREEHGWDARHNWEDILSLGEQQRLGMARLFFQCPKFGILDECTNATSIDIEEELYRVAKEMGITVITSSQRPALIPFHKMELRLIDGEGTWELKKIVH